MKNKKKKRLHLYIATYGIIVDGELTDNSTSAPTERLYEKIYATDDNQALDKAKEKREILDVIESAKLNPAANLKREIALLGMRRQDNKRGIYFCGYSWQRD